MKRIAMVLVSALAVAVTVPVLATEVSIQDGKLSAGLTVLNGDTGTLKAESNAEVQLAASEEGGWSAQAKLENLTATPLLGEYRVEFHDPLFRITAWGKGHETSDQADPFEFVKSVKKHDGDFKVRADVGPLTVDLDDASNLHLFAEQAIGEHTLGVAAQNQLPLRNGVSAVGYGKTQAAGLDITGALGMTVKEGVTDENIGYGVRAQAPIVPGVTGAVIYTSQPRNFVNGRNRDELKIEAEHESALVRINGSYARAVQADDRQFDDEVIEAVGDWRSREGNPDWDDQFESDQYFENVAPAFQVRVKQTRDNSQPTHELTVKGTMPVVAGRMWVNGSLIHVADKDADLNAQVSNLAETGTVALAGTARHTTFQADGYVQATQKLSLEPGMLYVTAGTAGDYLKLGAKAGYQVAPSGRLTAEYAQDYLKRKGNDSRLGVGFEVAF
jgi:hypothetical protein